MENQFQPLGVCQRLFNFIINGIVARGLKRITLGPSNGHRLTEIPISGSGGAYSLGEPMRDTIVHGMPEKDVNTNPVAERVGGGIIAIGGTQTQLQKEVPTGTSSSREVPLQGKESKHSIKDLSKDKEVDRIQVSEPVKTQKNGSEAKGPKKIISLKDEAEMGIIYKGKEEKTAKEKLTRATEPDDQGEKGKGKGKGKGKTPIPLFPIARVTSNIDEKSDAFIRSRKEALSRSDSKSSP